MYKQKLCFALSDQFGLPLNELILLLKKTGFDGFAIDISDRKTDAASLVETGKKENMIIQSLHAPFNKSDDMWFEGDLGDEALKELTENIELCAKLEIPIMVAHTFIGFDSDNIPTQLGIERYGKLVKRADELGVMLALENTEGEEYFDALMDAFKSEKSVGFCWDTGHELCYNRGRNLMADYGNRLVATHLNDNLGVRDFDGRITYIDDLHLLPFDGIADWNKISQNLAESPFDGPLTFELNTVSKPERHENDKYAAMPVERYIAEAYIRACKVASLYLKAKENMK